MWKHHLGLQQQKIIDLDTDFRWEGEKILELAQSTGICVLSSSSGPRILVSHWNCEVNDRCELGVGVTKKVWAELSQASQGF
jgi:hypothetical protein